MKKTFQISKTEHSEPVVRRSFPNDDYTINDHSIEVKYGDIIQIYELGWDVAKEKYRERPETFHLPEKYVPYLKQAIEEYANEHHLTMDTFEFKILPNGLCEITIKPTKGLYLFGIYAKYGRICEQGKIKIG